MRSLPAPEYPVTLTSIQSFGCHFDSVELERPIIELQGPPVRQFDASSTPEIELENRVFSWELSGL